MGTRPAITHMPQLPPAAGVLPRPAVPAGPSVQPDVTKPLFPSAGQVKPSMPFYRCTVFTFSQNSDRTLQFSSVRDVPACTGWLKKETLPRNSFNWKTFLYFFPVLQMAGQVASTSKASPSADTQSASPKALFPSTSQVWGCLPTLHWEPAALQLACTQLCMVCLWRAGWIAFICKAVFSSFFLNQNV